MVRSLRRCGRLAPDILARAAVGRGQTMPGRSQTSFPVMVANGTLYCGSGCMLGEICAE